MLKPNLFDYATSELSQDAFICWLLAWNYTDAKEASVSKAFVAFLYNSFIELATEQKYLTHWNNNDLTKITFNDVGAFLNDKMPMQQEFKTDVFL